MLPYRVDITTGVLDPDPKGKTGRGTIFWTTVKHSDGQPDERYEYGLLEVIDGSFDKDKITKPYLDRMHAEEKAFVDKEKAEKKVAEQERAASVKEDDAITKLLDDVIAKNEKTVKDYKSGNERAINFLTGMVIKESKARSMSVEGGAFAITELLKRKLA